MSVRVIPGPTTLLALGTLCVAVLLALVVGVSVPVATLATNVALFTLLAIATADYVVSRRAWRQSVPTMTRELPPAFAIAVRHAVKMTIAIPEAAHNTGVWRFELHDHADSSLLTEGLPVRLV